MFSIYISFEINEEAQKRSLIYQSISCVTVLCQFGILSEIYVGEIFVLQPFLIKKFFQNQLDLILTGNH